MPVSLFWWCNTVSRLHWFHDFLKKSFIYLKNKYLLIIQKPQLFFIILIHKFQTQIFHSTNVKAVYTVYFLSHVRLVPPAAPPQQPRPVALRTGDAVLHASGAPPPLLSIQAQLTPNRPSNPRPQQVPRCLFLNPHHHVPQVCMSTYVCFEKRTSH